MSMKIRLTERTPRRWRGNGFGYERRSYFVKRGNDNLAVVSPAGEVGWDVYQGAEIVGAGEYFWSLTDVRSWARRRFASEA